MGPKECNALQFNIFELELASEIKFKTLFILKYWKLADFCSILKQNNIASYERTEIPKNVTCSFQLSEKSMRDLEIPWSYMKSSDKKVLEYFN